MTLAARCGADSAARLAACTALLARVRELQLEEVRVAWADVHATLRCKTLVCGGDAAGAEDALDDALQDGIGMVSTLLLKDSSDRTAFKVFEPGALQGLTGFAAANNVLLLPDPALRRARRCLSPNAAPGGRNRRSLLCGWPMRRAIGCRRWFRACCLHSNLLCTPNAFARAIADSACKANT